MGDFLLGEAFGPLEQQMKFRVARQAALAANLANADTPGYRRVDIRFDQVLDDASVALRGSHARHITPVSDGPSGYRLETGPRGTRPDGNGVNVDAELVAANRNAGAFQDMAAILSRIIRLRQTAMSSGK